MDIDRIKEIETDAAVDSHMSDAADQFWEERELLNTLTVQFVELMALAEKCKGVQVLFGYPNEVSQISIRVPEFERLFGNNPDVYETDYTHHTTRAIDMNGVRVYCSVVRA
jgi:hypothetical protein